MDGASTGAAAACLDMSTVSGAPTGRGSDLATMVAAARSGDPAAVDRLYAAVRPRLLRSALALGAGPEAAPDLVQDVLWAVHRNLPRFDPERGTFEAWIATILVRRLANVRRARARRRRLLGAFRQVAPIAIESRARVVEARATLSRLLDALTERQREVVALYDIAELGADATANALGLTPAGVRSIARDAHRKLERAVREDVPREDPP